MACRYLPTTDATAEIYMTPALLVSVAALIFTVASFWWLQARRGKLILSGITAFSGYVATDRGLGIRLPILLYNTGARTRLVDELRLVFPSWDPGQAQWETFHPTLKPQSGDGTPMTSLVPTQSMVAVPRCDSSSSRIRSG